MNYSPLNFTFFEHFQFDMDFLIEDLLWFQRRIKSARLCRATIQQELSNAMKIYDMYDVRWHTISFWQRQLQLVTQTNAQRTAWWRKQREVGAVAAMVH